MSLSLSTRRTFVQTFGRALPLLFLPRRSHALGTIDMRAAGLDATGRTDASTRFRQVAASAGNDTTFFFPTGTYSFRDIRWTNASNLTFAGEGETSILQYRAPSSGYTFLLSFDACRTITFQDLALDNRNILHYGGVAFQSVQGMTATNVSFYDSAPRLTVSGDCYAFVFRAGGPPHTAIDIHDCQFDWVQLELDNIVGATVQHCTSTNSRGTFGIGSVSIGDGSRCEDFTIANNRIVDVRGGRGIECCLDPPSTNNGMFRNITILRNTIVKQAQLGSYGIQLGTTQTSNQTRGNLYRDIVITDNVLEVPTTIPEGHAGTRAVFLLSNGNFRFENVTLRGNSGGEYTLRYVNGGLIAHNTGRGLSFSRPQSTTVQDNAMTPTPNRGAYFLEASQGYNTWTRNTYTGVYGFTQRGATASSDSIEPPRPSA